MKLFFRKYGEGAPLIILHGLFGTADNWNTLGKKYGETFATYLVDQRNHGQSEHSGEWNYAVMADDLAALMDGEGLDKAHIMGHSMGGKTAMFFALKYPERLDKLIVSDIAPRYYAPHHQDVMYAIGTLDLDQTESRKQAEAHMEAALKDAGTRQFLLKNLYWKGEKLAWRFNFGVIRDQLDNVGEALPQGALYDGRTLFVRGGNSSYITAEDEADILAVFPHSEIITVPGAGHWVHAEKPMEFFEATMKFLKD